MIHAAKKVAALEEANAAAQHEQAQASAALARTATRHASTSKVHDQLRVTLEAPAVPAAQPPFMLNPCGGGPSSSMNALDRDLQAQRAVLQRKRLELQVATAKHELAVARRELVKLGHNVDGGASPVQLTAPDDDVASGFGASSGNDADTDGEDTSNINVDGGVDGARRCTPIGLRANLEEARTLLRSHMLTCRTSQTRRRSSDGIVVYTYACRCGSGACSSVGKIEEHADGKCVVSQGGLHVSTTESLRFRRSQQLSGMPQLTEEMRDRCRAIVVIAAAQHGSAYGPRSLLFNLQAQPEVAKGTFGPLPTRGQLKYMLGNERARLRKDSLLRGPRTQGTSVSDAKVTVQDMLAWCEARFIDSLEDLHRVESIDDRQIVVLSFKAVKGATKAVGAYNGVAIVWSTPRMLRRNLASLRNNDQHTVVIDGGYKCGASKWCALAFGTQHKRFEAKRSGSDQYPSSYRPWFIMHTRTETGAGVVEGLRLAQRWGQRLGVKFDAATMKFASIDRSRTLAAGIRIALPLAMIQTCWDHFKRDVLGGLGTGRQSKTFIKGRIARMVNEEQLVLIRKWLHALNEARTRAQFEHLGVKLTEQLHLDGLDDVVKLLVTDAQADGYLVGELSNWWKGATGVAGWVPRQQGTYHECRLSSGTLPLLPPVSLADTPLCLIASILSFRSCRVVHEADRQQRLQTAEDAPFPRVCGPPNGCHHSRIVHQPPWGDGVDGPTRSTPNVNDGGQCSSHHRVVGAPNHRSHRPRRPRRP